ncbi:MULTISPECIES: hypothetical protein [unclassified Sphingomonas]|uniref:hypothetical protein n=1 Tax=Novosphingobium rhizosphaerae TaxID=1551649 RepID=UPI0015CE7544
MRRLLAAMALVLLPMAAQAATLYLAPTGNDQADGRTAQTPLSTLAAAVARAQQAPAGEETRVIVLPGVYRGQSVDIDGRRLQGRLTIAGTASDPAAFPAFLGDGTSTWLHYRGAEGRDSGLTVQALRVARYATAISLNGNRNDPAAFNRGTVLENLVLAQIGSDAGTAKPSTAAIRLVNAKDTVVRGVFFHTIRNTPRDTCGGLHAIYLASHSTGARVEGNTFQDFCGSAIKLRDDSGGATIRANHFRDADGAPGIEEWFCDMDRTSECTKAGGECPSTGITVTGNDFGNLPADRRVLVRGSRVPRPWCPPGSAGAPRFLLDRGQTLP